jgi:hypothetical protein
MAQSFEHQDQAAACNFNRACVTPKHGRPADGEDDTVRRKLAEPRAFAHRQAH